MNRRPLPTPAKHASALQRWALAATAAALAMFLMLFYVQLLQDAVARGAQWRYSQTAPASPAANDALLPSATAAQALLVGATR